VRGCGQAAGRKFARRGLRNKSIAARFPLPAYKASADLLLSASRRSFQPGAREIVMAKGQMRSNKEKKKPKADKNLKKGGVAPVNPFASGKTPAGQSPNSKKN
jgi:hypothetical protein